ncbi:MAG: hypothetical protein JO149_07915 [Gammaproteobacteria bacterium]|nr:hypothetical protein [Gammaproteobacteria bacterium]
MHKKLIKLLIICLFPSFVFAMPLKAPTTLNDRYPWAFTYYYGLTVSDPLARIVVGELHRWPEHIQSAELAYTLNEENVLRRLLSPIVNVVQITGDVTMRKGANEHTIYELDPYLALRWTHLPWNQYVNTSFAFGEGISYASSVPALEKKGNDNTKRLLNLLIFEATFALPHYPQWQLVARIHHRSGAYGLYHAGNSGSNDVGFGIKYLFD